MVIKNGLVLTPDSENPQKLDLLIADGKIIDTGTGLDGGEVLDAKGLLILPGGIDAHVHFNTPGYTHREDFYHGSMAAIAGGITTVIDMPCTSVPPVTNKANLLKKLENIQGKSFVDFAFYGGVSLQAFEEGFPKFMEELAPYVCGFKTYFISGMETFERLDPFRFEMVLKKAGEIKRPVLLHAEDYEYVMGATEFAKENSNYSAYYHSRPEMAEILAVQRACKLAEGKNVQLHIVHVGTSEAVKIIRGYDNVTCETCPHYLEFTWENLDRIGPPLKTTPPVKSPGNKEILWDYLKDGWINYVASDHAPAPEEEKFTGSVWTDYSGIPGVQTLLPYIYTYGYKRGRISLKRLVQVLSENPAKRFGLFSKKGSIEKGKDADLILIDPEKEWILKEDNFYSRGKITPFMGYRFTGEIKFVLLRGNIVYPFTKLHPTGEFITPHTQHGP